LHQEILIDIETLSLKGLLTIPKNAIAIVVFAHGSGSGRNSPRNKYVAKMLQDRDIATLLVDLLTEEEEKIDQETNKYRFDIPFLANRLTKVCCWVQEKTKTKHLKIGLFGASTGAAAAIITASELINDIFAIVSRGGRPDLAGVALTKIKAPILLIVGQKDETVLKLNQKAFELIKSYKKIEIVPRATHLFEEPGTLQQASSITQHWFESCLML